MSRGITQKERRKLKSQYGRLAGIYRIMCHFFPGMAQWFNAMNDPRHQSYITYTQANLIMEVIMKCIAGIESMRVMTRSFNTEASIKNLAILSGTPELKEKPDWQTINNYLERLSTAELERIRTRIIKTLIRSRDFAKFTTNHSYCVIIDGTDVAYFNKKHCEHDLVKKVTNKTTGEVSYQYFHKALEAKILLGPGLVLSIGTEFIENEKEDASKQDCELNAAYRLLDKLKKEYPRMNFIIVGDALFFTMPFMEYVRGKHWDYIFRAKTGRQEKLMEDFEDLLGYVEEGDIVKNIYANEKGEARFVNHVEEVTGKPQVSNMIRYSYTDQDKEVSFDWATSIELNRSILTSAVKAGRSRWKIENEGFNSQKNGIYHLEHLCSLDSNAMKNHYLIIQIADILMQLYLAYDKILYELKEGIQAAANDLLVSIVSAAMSENELEYARRRTNLHLCCLLYQ